MKIRVPCGECLKKSINNDSNMNVAVRDDGVYRTNCPQGHETFMVLQNEHFEILVNFGLNAFLEGYFRETVVNMASSLEEYYKFYVELISLKHKVKSETFETSWNLISAQSERQLGAFIFVYTLNNQKSPILLTDFWKDAIKFRNAVIHKGKIPEESHTLKYCDAVFSLMRSYIFELHSKESHSFKEVRKRHNYQKHQLAKFRNTSISVAPTIFNIRNTATPHGVQETFSEALNEFREWKGHIYS